MAVKTIKLDELAKELSASANNQFREIRAATVSGCLRSIPALIKASPVDTGLYASSWDIAGLDGGPKDPVTIGNFSPHAPIIENGARPFTPPIAPLLAWAKRVLKDPSQPPSYSSRVWALAKGTQNKIAKVGMEPRFILENSIPMILENIKEEFRARE